MKKGTKIALGILGAVLVAGGAAAAWQWNNLNALRYGMTMDTDTLDERLEENQAVLDQTLKDYEIGGYAFSDEEVTQLTDGTLSAREAARKLLEQKQAEPEQPENPPEQPENAQKQPVRPEQTLSPEEEIRELIATMYALRTSYLGKLDAVVQSAIDEYTAGEHTSENRTKVVYGKIDELTAMEKECDSQVAAVVARLRELLKATGQDDSLARQVEETYREEKSLKKAYYLNEFRKG